MATTPLAEVDDVVAIWRPAAPAEQQQITTLIAKASSKLRHATPFDIDARMALWLDPATRDQPIALDPSVVADVVATIVARYLRNPDGFASTSEGVGPFSKSGTFVNRYDKTGSDVRGSIKVTPADIEELMPAVVSPVAFSFQVGLPHPSVVVPGYGATGSRGNPLPGTIGPVILPDYAPGSGAE